MIGGTPEAAADDCGATGETAGGASVAAAVDSGATGETAGGASVTSAVDSGATGETVGGATMTSVIVEVAVVSTSTEEETGASVNSAEEEGNGQYVV